MKHFKFVDYATQAYLASVGLLVWFFHGDKLPHWPFYIGAHTAGIILVYVVVKFHEQRPQSRILEILRHFYPILLFTFLYCETGWLNQLMATGYHDLYFFRLDHELFGCQPSLAFMASLPSLWVSELFYAAYFSYYLMIPGVGIALYLRDRKLYMRYVTVVSFVMYVCYLIYILFPVAGPRIFTAGERPADWPPELWPDPASLAYPASVEYGLFFQVIKFIYAAFETPGAAFPSSHVAAAIATLYFSWQSFPRFRWIHAASVILLCLATVYCQFHYGVDVLAGIATAVLLIPLAGCLNRDCTPAKGGGYSE